MGTRPRRVWWIVAVFLAVQTAIIALDVNGPFVDESLYIVAGMRVLEGHGWSDGYLTWFNGSPFVWPVFAALGHHAAGLSGARFAAVLFSAITLLAFAKTAETLFGRSASEWGALAFGVNGLFLALAHFAVYDVAALTALAVAMWLAARGSVTAAAVAFAGAVIAKFGHVIMVVPLLGLLIAARDLTHAVRALAVFLAVAGGILAAYFWLTFGSPLPTSPATYFQQTFGRARGHIAGLQVIFGALPLALATVGAVVAWRRRHRLLVVTCLLALGVYPAFHLWTANFVSGQKHVVAGFLFSYLLAGVALERLWIARARATTVAVLAVLTIWGALQCYWQDHSWSDTRPLVHHLASHMKRGDRIVAESSWNYTLYLYPRGLISAPAEVIDANYGPRDDHRDLCEIRWLAGNPDSAAMIRDALGRCPHERVRSSTTWHYYFDTTRLRLGTSPVVVGLYRLGGS